MLGCDIKSSDSIELERKPAGRPQPQPNDQLADQDENDDPNTLPENQLLSFDYLKKTSLASCVRCHARSSNPEEKPLLRNRAEILKHFDRVTATIIDGTMPPPDGRDKPLNSCERALLDAWVDAGKPSRTNIRVQSLDECKPVSTPPEPIPDPIVDPNPTDPGIPEDAITFDHLLKSAFVSCAGCHTTTKKPIRKPILLTIEDYRQNIGKVQATVMADEMPQTDSGDQLLTPCEKAMMNKWIELGTPEKTEFSKSNLPECLNSQALVGIK